MSVKCVLGGVILCMFIYAIFYYLGSVREAEKFEKMSPEEAKTNLAKLLPLMDTNDDKQIDRKELKEWILNNFV